MMKWPFSYPVIGNEGLFVFSKTNKRHKCIKGNGEHIIESIGIY